MIRCRAQRIGLSIVALCLVSAAAAAESRHLAVILDTSGSMDGNDPPRYTVQLSKILSDLLADDDELTVVRMPGRGLSHLTRGCDVAASNQLAMDLEANDREGFKRRLDGAIEYQDGTHFAAPIRTAVEALSRSADKQRMLLIIADSGGLGRCGTALTEVLAGLGAGGTVIAAINLGSSAGAFDRNPAFDFTTSALDAAALVDAVALVYQKFLGAKKVQTGTVETSIRIELAPFVDEAFLVVAADGPIGSLEQGAGNPGAAAVDLNHRGGGETLGLDRRRRGYRIARLERPGAGPWTFHIPGLDTRAGWMLLQDSAVGVRMRSPPTFARGVATPLEVELYDQTTGQAIRDLSRFRDLDVSLDVDGRKVSFRDDGTGGDATAGDGILTAVPTFDQLGRRRLPLHLESDLLDRTIGIDTEVVESAWRLKVRSPPTAEVGRPVTLEAGLEPLGDPARLVPPERIEVPAGGLVVELRDDGRGADAEAGDQLYSGAWTPPATGTVDLDYVPVGGTDSPPATHPLTVTSALRFAPPRPVELGALGSGEDAAGVLDLRDAEVRGESELEVTSDFDLGGSRLEIDLGDGWRTLDDTPQTVRVSDHSALSWPLRLRTGRCPQGWEASRPFTIRVADAGDGAGSGLPASTEVPLRLTVVEDSWLVCWWPALAAVLGMAILAVAVHGYWSPSRFPPRLGVVLSPEEDMEEGFFYPIRAQRGSRSGFYRDARIYVSHDFRLSSHPRSALVRLRADGQQVRLQAMEGATVWRRTADDVWERLPPGETPARFGTVYRNDMKTLYLEVRNG